MSFSPGSGGSGGSDNISSSGDVSFNNPSNNDVLQYDSSVAKWRNKPAPATDSAGNVILPTGAGVVMKDSSNADWKVTVNTSGVLNVTSFDGGGGGEDPPPTGGGGEAITPNPVTVTVDNYSVTIAGSITTTSSITFDGLNISIAHDTSGYPWVKSIAISDGATVSGTSNLSGTTTLSPGNYVAYVSYSIDGRSTWITGAKAKFTIAAPTYPGDGGTNGPEPMAFPAKSVGLYHMMWSNSGSPALSTTPANVNVVYLAFAQGDPPSLVGWSNQGQSTFVSQANALRQAGKRIIISIGGAGGHVNVSNRQAFVNGIMNINSQITLDGLDWDLEGPAMAASDVVWIGNKLKELRGPNFAITMAPNGSNIDHYRPIAVQCHNNNALDFIGQQYYDAVVSYSAAKGRLDQLASAGIPQNKMGIGMMVGSADTYWTVDECIAAVNYMKGFYPNIRGGYLWEAGRAGTADWANRVGSLLLA